MCKPAEKDISTTATVATVQKEEVIQIKIVPKEKA